MTTDVPARQAALADRFEVFDWHLETSGSALIGLTRIGPRVGAYALLRLAGAPVGRLLVLPRPTPSLAELQRLALDACGPEFDGLLATHGMRRGDLFDSPNTSPNTPAPVATTSGPHEPLAVSVVICTRERPDGLRAALSSVLQHAPGPREVIVVDNAPSSDATAGVCQQAADPRVRYVREDRPGLSVARNRGLAAVTQPVVAWLDDDEIADPDWVAQLVAGFDQHPDVSAVSGLVFPAELETTAQIYYESYGGHTKGRLMTAEVFDPVDRDRVDPLFPVPPFGVGANMAFRTHALRGIGGFDEALGAGVPTRGGEDTLVFSQLLLRGDRCMYQPTAVTRHTHRKDMNGFDTQMYGYGVGLSAFYTALIRTDPRVALRLPRLLLRGVRALRGAGEADSAVLGEIPAASLRRKWFGFAAGPFLYLRTRRRHAAMRP